MLTTAYVSTFNFFVSASSISPMRSALRVSIVVRISSSNNFVNDVCAQDKLFTLKQFM